MCRVAACDDGFYSNRTRATSRGDCIPSPEGHASRAGATTPEECRTGSFADREASARCTPCGAGSYQDAEGATACKPCEGGAYCKEGASLPVPCPAGRFSASRSLASDAGCELCTLGHACSSGSSSPQPCAAGRFGATRGQTSRDCTGACVEGHFCFEGSMSNTSERCRELPPGFRTNPVSLQRGECHQPTNCLRMPSSCSLQRRGGTTRTSEEPAWPIACRAREGHTRRQQGRTNM